METKPKENTEEKEPFEFGFDEAPYLGNLSMPEYIAARKAMKPEFHEQTSGGKENE